MPDTTWITTAKAAEFLGVERQTVLNWAEKGLLRKFEYAQGRGMAYKFDLEQLKALKDDLIRIHESESSVAEYERQLEESEEALTNNLIKEIKVSKQWKEKKEECIKEAEEETNKILDKNKNKNKDINVDSIKIAIKNLRNIIAETNTNIIKEIEIGIELENKENIVKNINKVKEKKPVGRPKKLKENTNQIKIKDYFKNK